MMAGMRAALVALIATQTRQPSLPVSAFSNTNKIYSPRLSPDGKHLAVSADFGEATMRC